MYPSQYDDPAVDSGITLDQRGLFTGEELRRRLEGGFEDLNSLGKTSTDYYTHEEMLQFKKPKNKKSLRKKDKLDIDALDAEAVSAYAETDVASKSLERARKLALKKQVTSGPEAIARLAASTLSRTADDQNPQSQENKVVFTEMDEFVWGLQLDEEARKPDVFIEEEVVEPAKEERPAKENKEDIVLDEIIHEAAVGKGLSGALRLLKERGTLKESIEWGGRNMDKKKSKLVGIADNDGIHIERLDEFGRIMTPKEAFRKISHKFHGKGPGKMKQEKRLKQYYEELKLKGMKNSDLPGGLTPMLGDRKVEHFLGIKRKVEPDNTGSSKKPKN